MSTRSSLTDHCDAGAASEFVSSFFAPVAGISSDPATTSGPCALGSFLAGRFSNAARRAARRGNKASTSEAGKESD